MPTVEAMPTGPQTPNDEGFAGNAGDCAALLRTTDWARTELGRYDAWPQSLKSFVSMVIEMPTPAIIFWGPDLVQLYNDGYGVIMGPRHPRYFGAPYRECWPDTYPVIYPWMQRVLRGEVIQVENSLFVLTRYGFTEEAYFTFTFSPLRDDQGTIAGVFQPVVEVTQQVLGARRADTLRSLIGPRLGSAVRGLLEALAGHPKDVPFAVFYGGDEAEPLRRVDQAAIDPASVHDEAPPEVQTAFDERRSVRCAAVRVVRGEHVGTWGEPTRDALAVPVTRSSDDQPRGVLLFGVSPRLQLDGKYREFFETIARELAAALDGEAAERAEMELSERAAIARAEADRQQQRLQSVFVQAPVAITILTGLSHTIELANPMMCKLWGRELEHVLGRGLFEAIPDLAGQGLEALLDGVRTTGEPYVGVEVPVKMRRDPGQPLEDRFFNFVYEPLRDVSEHPTGVIVVAADVTAQVQARQAAEKSAAEVDGARRDAELARDAAQRANRSKDEFLAMLGHELRNPLAPMFTALELLRLRGLEPSHSREWAVIDRQSRHLASLVEDLLDVSRIATGKVDLKRERLDLAEIVTKAVETASPLLEKHRHELTIEAAPGLLVEGDSARLTQVFANLLTNAAKYTDLGGRIVIRQRPEGGEAVVEVSDTGRGISSDMLPRLFGLFVQAPQNLDRALGGLGLGLAIVKSIVAMHGGRVEAHSDGPGHGSKFTVRLPLVVEDRSGVAGELASADPRSRTNQTRENHRVLVVDDNEDAAVLLAEMLTILGHTCTLAHDGARALEIATRETFDVVLLDIGLPAMDGYEVARHLRAVSGWERVTMVAITGYGQREDRQRSFEAGFDYHLVKPIEFSELLAVLERGREPT